MTHGSLTLEMLIALSVLTTTLVGSTLLLFGGEDNALDIRHTLIAELQDHTDLANLLSTLQKNIHAHATRTTGTSTETYISPCAKKISSKNERYTSHNFIESTTYSMVVGSVSEAKKLGENCDPFPPADTWKPYGSIASTTVNGATSTDIALSTTHGIPYAFVTTVSASTSAPDLFIFDVSHTTDPILVASVDTGTGINGISIAGDFAYILENANTNQLKVLNISDPLHPTVIATRSLPNISFTCSPTTEPCLSGKSIFYYDGRIYLGTGYIAFGATSAYNNEFHIFCVDDTKISGCSPANPVWLGSLNINHTIHDIVVQDSLAYLATSDDTGELMLVDITHPESLKHPDVTHMKFDAQTITNDASTEDGRSVFVLGSTVYLGRQRVNTSAERELYILDTSKPDNITVRIALNVSMKNNAEYVSGIVAQGDLLFVSTTNSTEPLLTFSQTYTDTGNVGGIQKNILCGTTGGSKIGHIVYRNDLLFTVNQTNALMQILQHKDSCS